ncbi:MAG: 2-succinyl-6-hydroxy-2,4-cyclohexadiene-1-carboxylate synthase [Chloroflexi bacterium]|nr:2-succinyl-6-hydroxy-2,4-cyclohexadiene-1-carboxylate synthase [Chloroflexota bacterium]
MRLRVNGLSFHVQVAGAGPSLLLLHGFTGSSENWQPTVEALGEGRRTIRVDLIGHGETESPKDRRRYAVDRAVRDLAAVLDVLEENEVDVLGYSLGGRVALQFAHHEPRRVRRLVLESASPGIDDPRERAERVAADEALADRIEREGLSAFVDYWERIPLFASQASLPAETRAHHRAQRLRGSTLGLANSLRGMGAGAQVSLRPQLAELSVPTLAVAGALDSRYCEIAEQMGALLPNARTAIIPGAGHTVHLEQPALFHQAVRDFLATLPSQIAKVAPQKEQRCQ